MTEILDSNGNTIRVGARTAENDGTVTALGEPDGDVNSYGRMVAILPTVTVAYDDGTEDTYPARWNATGPWDDHRDDYTCDDLEIAVDEHGQGVNLSAVERLERFAKGDA